MNYYAQSPWRALCGLLIIAFVVVAPAAAEPPLAVTQHGGTVVSWDPQIAYDHVVLTVSGPAGNFTRTFAEGEVPHFDLATLEGAVDGSYGFELTFAPRLAPEVRQMMQAVRLEGGDSSAVERHLREQGQLPAQPLVQSGNLRVLGGQFLVPNREEPTTLTPRTPGDAGLSSVSDESLRNVSAADQVINDDLIVQNSLCVGTDCVNGESFGFDTIRLKENNLRIKFDDTSNSASFPFVDWQLVANESDNGGRNMFAIEDVTNGRFPFTIEATARNNALYVEADGDVGIGTRDPVTELHIVRGDTPTVRLEQDGSSGFTAQTWDLAGNEANFFVRDVSNGSKLPFRIKPGAGDSSIFVDTNSNVLINGQNLTAADAALHVRRSNGTAKVLVQETSGTLQGRVLLELINNGATRFELLDTSQNQTWRFANGGTDFSIVDPSDAPGQVEFNLDPAGNLTISGVLTTGGMTCGSGCDLVFHEPDTRVESIEDHAALMWANKYLPAVGPTKEGEPVNITEKTGGMLNELEKAHIYIEQLNTRLVEKEDEIATLHERLARLEQHLDLE